MNPLQLDFHRLRCAGTPWCLILTPDYRECLRSLCKVLAEQDEPPSLWGWDCLQGHRCLSEAAQTGFLGSPDDTVQAPALLLKKALELPANSVLFFIVPKNDLVEDAAVIQGIAKLRRTELGWTQDALAEKAGISKSFLSDLENGRRSIGAETLLDLGRAMAVSLDFLMIGEESSVHHEEPQIPASLALLAEKEGLSVRQALTLLRIREHIAESRRSPKKANDVDWLELYLAVKKFL